MLPPDAPASDSAKKLPRGSRNSARVTSWKEGAEKAETAKAKYVRGSGGGGFLPRLLLWA